MPVVICPGLSSLCIVYRNRIITAEPQSNANLFYDKFNIECPCAFKKNGPVLTPQNDLELRHSYVQRELIGGKSRIVYHGRFVFYARLISLIKQP